MPTKVIELVYSLPVVTFQKLERIMKYFSHLLLVLILTLITLQIVNANFNLLSSVYYRLINGNKVATLNHTFTLNDDFFIYNFDPEEPEWSIFYVSEFDQPVVVINGRKVTKKALVLAGYKLKHQQKGCAIYGKANHAFISYGFDTFGSIGTEKSNYTAIIWVCNIFK